MSSRFLKTFMMGLLALSMAFPVSAAASGGDPIHLKSRTITPDGTTLPDAALEAVPDGRQHILVQFSEIPDDDRRAELEERFGLDLLTYVPEGAWYAAVSGGELSSLAGQEDVTYVSPVKPVDKIDPSIRKELPERSVDGDGSATLVIEGYSDVASSAVREVLAAHGTVAGERSEDRYTLKIDTSGDETSKLWDIAEEDAVRWISTVSPDPRVDNDDSRQLIKADTVQSSPYGLTGDGYTAAMWDGGLAGDHADLDGKTTDGDSDSITYHATHIAGTILGAGTIEDKYRGVAPDAELVSYNWPTSSTSELYSETDDALGYGAVVSHNSWGWTIDSESDMGRYGRYSAAYDRIISGEASGVDGVLSVVFSAGNEGNDGWDSRYDTITGTGGTSKNTITVGALADSGSMTRYSSWGPTDDGRIKPDLMANGQMVASTKPGDEYGYKSGSSIAAPAVSGAVILMNQAYDEVHGTLPSPATVKAVLLHTADDLASDGPDYRTGWGKVDLQDAADLVEADGSSDRIITESIEESGGTDSHTFTVPADASEARFTLVWSDPAGSTSASKTLVNDLDLVVTDQSGRTYDPWILDPSDPSDPATTGEDHRNPVEQVVVSNPTSETLTVTVEGESVPEPAQSYTLVSSLPSDGTADTGDTTPPQLEVLSPESREYSTGSIWFNVSADEAISAASVEVDGTSYQLQAADSNMFGRQLEMDDGSHTATFRLEDTAGNANTATVDFSVMTETTQPEPAIDLRLHSPEETTYSSSSVPLEYTTNRDIARGWYAVDGGDRHGISGNTTIDLSDGSHELTLYGEDSDGNSDSETVQFTIDTGSDEPSDPPSDDPGDDTTPPVITIDSPDGSVSGSPVWFNVSLDEPASYVKLTLNRDTTHYLEASDDRTSFHGQFPVDTGLNTGMVMTADDAGNFDYETFTFDVKESSDDSGSDSGGSDDGSSDDGSNDSGSDPVQKPSITLLEPENTTYDSRDSLPLTYDVANASDVWYAVDGETRSGLAGDTTFSVDADGKHSLTLYAAGDGSQVSETRYFSVDTSSDEPSDPPSDDPDGSNGSDSTPPEIRIVSPEAGGTYDSDRVWFNVTMDEPVTYAKLTLNRQDTYRLDGDGSSFSGQVPVREGLNTAMVMTEDRAGNFVYETITFTAG